MAKKKTLKVKTKKKTPKHPLMNLKVSGKDRRVILAMAKKYADGNYSAWMRHAAMKYKPKAGEFIR